MVKKVDTAIVRLWGETVGAVAWMEDRDYGVFEYDPAFLKKGFDISPIHMGLTDARRGDGIFSFPGLGRETFRGLPGLLADALPDKFGNNVIDAWLARNGRDAAGFSPVERLCYMGRRAMGGLEFAPPVDQGLDRSVPVEVSDLVDLARNIMAERLSLSVEIGDSEKENAEAILDILRVGTSAGGARPKAVIAMDKNGNVVSGQADIPEGYDCWILKFDGVTDLELGESRGYGRIEYAYHLMARAAGIDMEECRLLEENGRAHFMTRRFDRRGNRKIHLQSLCGMAHFDFNNSGGYAYEQAFAVMRRLRLGKPDAIRQFRRMVFNVVARNQDDHTKNIAFLMDRDGRWTLTPAFDVIYSHKPAGRWTNQHQMTINGKRDNFTAADLIAVGESISIPRPRNIIDEVIDAVSRWQDFAAQAGVDPNWIADIARYHRLEI